MSINIRSPRPVFPPIESLVPHRGTMLLIDAVCACSDSHITVLARANRHAWYADENGAMPAWIGIELMAQAIAAHAGLLATRTENRARPGVLLGANHYEALVSAFAPDSHLAIHATELLRSEAGHGAYECVIETLEDTYEGTREQAREAQRVAQAVIKVFQPADFQAFIEGSFSS
jgi:predicted hotdog family 3-hydroxylacyl-ACP dehydratase